MAEGQEKHAGGRPTKYEEDFPERVRKFVKKCVEQKEIPTIEELSDELDVSNDSVANYEKIYPEFFVALERLRRKQKAMLMQLGLKGEYNSTMAKLILAANHQMRDGTDDSLKMTGNIIFNES